MMQTPEEYADALDTMAEIIMDASKSGRLEAKCTMERAAKFIRALTAPQLHQHGGGVEAFSRILAARKKHVDAVAAYNARREYLHSLPFEARFNLDIEYRAMSDAQSEFIKTTQDVADAALAQQPLSVPARGGAVTDWWQEWVKQTRTHKALRKAAQLVVDQTDSIHDNEPWPLKYRAPYEAITALRSLLSAAPAHPIQSDVSCSRAREGGTV